MDGAVCDLAVADLDGHGVGEHHPTYTGSGGRLRHPVIPSITLSVMRLMVSLAPWPPGRRGSAQRFVAKFTRCDVLGAPARGVWRGGVAYGGGGFGGLLVVVAVWPVQLGGPAADGPSFWLTVRRRWPVVVGFTTWFASRGRLLTVGSRVRRRGDGWL